MRLAIIGDGKMARAVSALAAEGGDVVTRMMGEQENRDGAGIEMKALGDPEVAVEFTEPASATANILACARAGLPVVVGTTGWYADLDRVAMEVKRLESGMLWAPNFSIGASALALAAEATAAALREIGGFDVHLLETHHGAKKDKPSGTAGSIADRLARVLGANVSISSVRVGHVPGTHEVIFDAPFEQIRLVHEARDRRVFAAGALRAAHWLLGRRGVFTLSDMLQSGEEVSR